MKKEIGLVILILILGNITAYSQEDTKVRLGLKISPTINFNRFQSNVDSISVNNSENSFKYLFGLFTDFRMSDNYIFNTGVMYTSRKLNFSATGASGAQYNEEFVIDYIEIPLTLKLLTNEFSIDTRVYAQIGFAFDITVNQTSKNNPELNTDKYSSGDASFYIGAGIDKMLGTTTGLFLGLFYQRGLVDISGKNELITAKNDILGLDFGIKF